MRPEPAPAAERPRWREAFQYPRFSRFQGARTLSLLGVQTQSVAIGWQIYSVTGRPLDLAWVGLAQFLPAVALSLVTGHTADRFDSISANKEISTQCDRLFCLRSDGARKSAERVIGRMRQLDCAVSLHAVIVKLP